MRYIWPVFFFRFTVLDVKVHRVLDDVAELFSETFAAVVVV